MARTSHKYAYDATRCHLGDSDRLEATCCPVKEVRLVGKIPAVAPVPRRPRLAMVSWIRHHARSQELAQALGAQAVYMPWAWH